MVNSVDKINFINTIAPLVVKTESDFFNSVTIAQACLETGYGTSKLYKAFHNLFGFKAKAGEWTGKVVGDYPSDEEIGGVKVKDVPSDFRAYDSILESIQDHAFMMSNRGEGYKAIYKKALTSKTPYEQASALTGTYATDSSYGEKLIEIIDSFDLTNFDEVEKEKRGVDHMVSIPAPRTPIKRHTLVNMEGYLNKVEYIIIHFVGASGQARANADYFYNVFRSASANFFIDPHETYEVVPENRVAWHIGDGSRSGVGKNNGYVYEGGATNYNSIGIEGCQDVTTGPDVWHWDFHPETYRQMLLLTSHLMDKYNVPLDHVIRHHDASGKMCPGNWQWDNWFKWNKFKKDLANLRSGKTQGSGNTAPNKYNPKNYDESPVPPVKTPINAFKELNIGDTVTIRSGSNWYNPGNNHFILSPNVAKSYGKSYKIKEVKKVEANFSKRAYLLDGVLSWILEQDIVEARSEWGEGISASKYTVNKGDTLWAIAQKFGVSVDDLKKWNGISTNLISIGQLLFVVEPADVAPAKPVEDVKLPDTIKPVDSQPSDDGDKTPAISLKEGELMDWTGKIYRRVK